MKEGVTYKRLGEVAPSIKYDGEIVPKNGMFWLLNLDMVEANTGKVLDKVYVSKGELDGSITPFSPDNVLYSKLRPYLNKVVLPDEHGYCTTELVPLYPQKDQISREYLAYFLRSNTFVGFINEKVAGAKMPRVKMSDFWNYPIPVPSLSFQEQVVKELDCIAAIVDDKKRQLSELDSLAQAIFYDAFGDPVSNTKHWGIKKIGDFSELVAGATPSTKVDEYWNDGTIAWLSSGEVGKRRIYKTESLITQKGYDSCSTRLVPAHTLLIALAGQGKTRGTVGVAEIPLCTNQSVCSFLTDETVDVDFLYYLLKLQYDKLRSISNSAGGRGGLNLTLLRNFSVIFPPLILQQEVSRKLKMVEEQKELIQQSIKEFENLLAQRMEFHFA